MYICNRDSTVTLYCCSLCQCSMYEVIIVLNSMSLLYVQAHYCTEFCISALCAWALLYCRLCQCGLYTVILLLQLLSVRYIQGYYCIAVCVRDLYTRTYCIVVYVSSVGTGSLLYCSVCQCAIYRVVIVLHFMSVMNVQGHYFAAACVIGVCTL